MTDSALPDKPPKKTGTTNLKLATAPDPEKQLEELDKPAPKKEEKKGSLLAEQPETPTVANGRIKVFYDKPHFSKYKDVVLIALQVTVPLTDKHLKLVPKVIADAFHDINKKGRSRINLRDVPPQQVSFYLESDRKTDLVTVDGKLVGTNLAVIQRKGEGTARKIIRLSFRIQCALSDSLEEFASKNLNNDFWIEMGAAQKDLWDEDDDE